jgi:hypothetical protein
MGLITSLSARLSQAKAHLIRGLLYLCFRIFSCIEYVCLLIINIF